jgi:DinB superfamily
MRRLEGEKMLMRKASVVVGALLVPLLGGMPAHGQQVSHADRDRALDYLESTKRGVLEATKGLSATQWNFKPAPDRWSVAEVMEHIAAAEDMLRGLDEQVMKSPAIPARDPAELKKTDETVLAAVPDRSHKAQAPEPLRPINRFGSPEEAQKHFVQARAETEAFLKNTPELRAHVGDSPLGKLDGYQWVLLIAAHSERHTKQILEVKADPNFPAK